MSSYGTKCLFVCVQALKSFQLKIEVDPQHHPKIIGKRGAIISKIRADHDVNIQFPDRSDENPNVITITGYEENACRARDEIMNIVKELVSFLFFSFLFYRF